MTRASTEFESALDALPVKLENFEGPLDLLLHLIKKNEVNIYDIPIALITQQYLDTIQLMQELESRHRGRVPRHGGDAHPHQVEDAAAAARDGRRRGGRGGRSARRAGAPAARAPEVQGGRRTAARARAAARRRSGSGPTSASPQIAGDDYEPELEVDLFSLLTAFQAVVERAKQRPKVLLPPEQMPVEVRIEQLLARLSETEACGFEELFADVDDRAGLIVTFLALLEMIRLKLVRVFQSGSFGPIRVYKRPRPADAPHPIGDPEAHRGMSDDRRMAASQSAGRPVEDRAATDQDGSPTGTETSTKRAAASAAPS